ncbi:hypothetical protein [Haloquadratum walsbyi]|uniref:Uncharacterized protein n=1 Tax=Haloquadratum walsbyi J07HQW2 TaxID=1238425 RepID=U1PP06_9EURY|nr:hypothetical protein [Haloquadratum walsbyi]ERG94021.1 MAG: hypothetical protein J07HQW2_00455 [Haloquadratum walsbyi J07HQW2]
MNQRKLSSWIVHAHGSNLPGSLIKQCNTGHVGPYEALSKSEAVDGAIGRFDIDDGGPSHSAILPPQRTRHGH